MKVAVALSGGPESLVTAWLLKKQGMQVRGVHFDLVGKDWVSDKIQEIERKLGISIQVIPVSQEVKDFLANEREEALNEGRLFFPKQSFHQGFLMPRLIDFKNRSHYDRIATGHRVGLQEDPVAQITRVVQGTNPELEESELILGVPQNDLKTLICPLGTIPGSMLEKLVQELGPESMTQGFEFNWNEFMNQIEIRPGVGMGTTFFVTAPSGMRINVAGTGQTFTLGARFTEREGANQVYRVIEISPRERKIIAQLAPDVKVAGLDLDRGHWFGRPDLKLTFLDCGILWEGRKKALPVRLIQYEGNRMKGVFAQPLIGDEVNVFKGQTVLFLNGPEVLGGARVFQSS